MNLKALGWLTVAALMAGCQEGQELKTDLVFNPATVSAEQVDAVSRPVLSFTDTTWEFGTVSAGRMLGHTFHFVNDGPGVAVIADVSSSCGCTIPKTWPRNPLQPGEHGDIEVFFDTHDKSGPQNKVVSVVANTEPSVVRLHLVGEVIAPN